MVWREGAHLHFGDQRKRWFLFTFSFFEPITIPGKEKGISIRAFKIMDELEVPVNS